MERKSVAARCWVREGLTTKRSTRKFFQLPELFCILFVVVVINIFVCVKTYRTVYQTKLLYVNFVNDHDA